MPICVISFVRLHTCDPRFVEAQNGLRAHPRGDNARIRSYEMRDLLAGITPIAAGLALAVIIHRSERGAVVAK